MELGAFGYFRHPTKEDNRPTNYYDFLEDDKYVEQFLNAQDMNLDMNQEISEEPAVQFLALDRQEYVKEGQKSFNEQMKVSKKRSTFHNFQKHLVTTIRSIIDSSKLGQDVESATCEKKIWRVFMNSHKINKTLVSLAVGDLTEEQAAKTDEYGFKDVLSQFKSMQIKQAQQNIYYEIVKQLSSANLDEELTKRRMKHKKQFIVYFRAFLEELVKGELDKRMAKCTKLLKNEHL